MTEDSEQTEISEIPSEEEVRRFFQSNEPIDQLAKLDQTGMDADDLHSMVNYSAYPNVKRDGIPDRSRNI